MWWIWLIVALVVIVIAFVIIGVTVASDMKRVDEEAKTKRDEAMKIINEQK